jgi:regulator of sigma D
MKHHNKESGGLMAIVEATVNERRAHTREMIAKLVAERTEMLVLYCSMAGLEPFTASKPVQVALQEFCQILIDYIASGHFVLYERIANGTERRREVAKLAEELHPRIARATEMALDFNDKYDCEDHCNVLDTLAADLSQLGEEMAVRIELEDRLLEVLVRK